MYAESFQLCFVQTPKFTDMDLVYRYYIIFIVPLHAFDGGENVFPHHFPDLVRVGAFVPEDMVVPFLPNAPHDHTK